MPNQTTSFIIKVFGSVGRFLDWFYEVFIQRRHQPQKDVAKERYQNIMGAIDDVKREVGETREVVVRQNQKLAALQDQITDLKAKLEEALANGDQDALRTIATDLDNIQKLATQEELPPTENPAPSEPTEPAEQPQPSA